MLISALLLLLNEHQVDEVLFIVAELLSHVQLFATPWTVARQAPLSMGFSRQEYWSGLPFPSPWLDYNNFLLESH